MSKYCGKQINKSLVFHYAIMDYCVKIVNLFGMPCFLGDSGPLPTNAIRAHKDFRMIVLANRPGFPFLGNDFFGAMGRSKYYD